LKGEAFNHFYLIKAHIKMGFLDKQITKMVATTSKSDDSLPKIDLENGSAFLSFERIAKFADVINNYKKNGL